MRSCLKIGILLLCLLGGVLYFGPQPDYPAFDADIEEIALPLSELDSMIRQREQNVSSLKPDNEARIIWADSMRKTPFSIVYLHGFSASPMEGKPLVFDLANRYGCNLYLARLPGHGVEDAEAFAKLTPAALVGSAKEALAIGRAIGEQVILMSCSTGSTLSIYLSASHPEAIFAQLMYSPNIDIEDQTADLLTLPWGLQLARWVTGGNYHSFSLPAPCRPYWTMRYRLEGLICLKSLLNETMKPSIFEKIRQPYFIGYYYKNEEAKDDVISVDAIKEFNKQTATLPANRQLLAFPDVDTHVIINDCQSKNVAAVRQASVEFIERVLGLVAVDR